MNSFDKLRLCIAPDFMAFAFMQIAGCAPAPDIYGLFGGNNGGGAAKGSAEQSGSGGMPGTAGSGGAGTGDAGSTSGTGGAGGTAGTGGSGGSGPTSLYLVSIDHAASPSVLLKVDVATGVGKVACTLPNNVDAINYHSTTFSRTGTLFASNYQDAHIDKIDPCTCEVTPVGPTGFASIPGITVNKGPGLYGIETTADILLDIDTTTGQGTKLGDLGFDFTTSGATWSDALNDNQGGLYAISGATNSLHSISHMTGGATALTPITGVTFGSVGIEMHSANGIIYACTNDAVLYAIDPVTGAATGIGTGMGHVSDCNNLAAPWQPVACLDAL
jgi:hypothetical protein